jgi:hypothetical protein
MRIALISDIHANLPALEAVLADIDGVGVDASVHLGDLVGYAPWPNELIEGSDLPSEFAEYLRTGGKPVVPV